MKAIENLMMDNSLFEVADGKARMDIEVIKKEINTRYEEVKNITNINTEQVNSKMENLEQRMDTFTSLNDGSTTGDAELQDIRIGNNGITYNSAGESVRKQVELINKDINSLNLYDVLKSVNDFEIEYYNQFLKCEYKTLVGWKYLDVLIHLPAGEHTLIVSDVHLSSVGTYKLGKTLADADLVLLQTKPGIHPFILDEECDVHLTMQVSTSNTAELGTYYLSRVSIIKGRYSKNVLLKMLNNNTKKPMNEKIQLTTLNSLGSMTIPVSNIKQNYVIGFKGRITSFDKITISHGKTSGWCSAYVVIDSSKVYVYEYLSSEHLIETNEHGLSISDFINVIINVKNNKKANLIITTKSGVYTKEITWNGSREDIKVESNNSVLSNCELSFSCTDYNKKIWAFGDSYFDMWTFITNEYGFDNYMMDGFSGRGSVDALNSLNKCLEYNTPEILIWCLGMNNADNDTSVNASWLNVLNQVKEICLSKDIELILMTIPTTPIRNNNFKNEHIYSSGYRYIDCHKAVGSDVTINWFDGLLSSDNVHPTDMGSKVLASTVIISVPELLKN